MDPDYLNCMVHDYISTVDPKLAKKFKKEAKLTSELPPGSPVIGDVVKYFNKTSNDTKIKRKISESWANPRFDFFEVVFIFFRSSSI